MKVRLYTSFKEKEHRVIEAFADGVRSCDLAELRGITPEPRDYDCDVAVVFGVKGRNLFKAYRNVSYPVVMLDKAFLPGNRWEYIRASVNAHQPTEYLMDIQRPFDRLERLGIAVKPWRRDGHIVIAGSSEKYHAFHGLCEPNEYAEFMVREIREYDRARHIVYRPKPTWRGGRAISGASFSGRDESLEQVLRNASVLVTHGSGASINAIIAGVPCIVLGGGVAAAVSSAHISDVLAPMQCSDDDRMQWLANLAYCQWTREELRSGMAWQHIRAEIRKVI